jgi:hypothetical protein
MDKNCFLNFFKNSSYYDVWGAYTEIKFIEKSLPLLALVHSYLQPKHKSISSKF